MSVTDGIGQTPCSLEHYLVRINFANLEFLRRLGTVVVGSWTCDQEVAGSTPGRCTAG